MRAVPTATCSAAGAGGQGSVCTTSTDCLRNYDCLDTGTGKHCSRNCAVGGSTCGGLTCVAFSTPFVLDGVEHGTCN